jgi:hypothetical protein
MIGIISILTVPKPITELSQTPGAETNPIEIEFKPHRRSTRDKSKASTHESASAMDPNVRLKAAVAPNGMDKNKTKRARDGAKNGTVIRARMPKKDVGTSATGTSPSIIFANRLSDEKIKNSERNLRNDPPRERQ